MENKIIINLIFLALLVTIHGVQASSYNKDLQERQRAARQQMFAVMINRASQIKNERADTPLKAESKLVGLNSFLAQAREKTPKSFSDDEDDENSSMKACKDVSPYSLDDGQVGQSWFVPVASRHNWIDDAKEDSSRCDSTKTIDDQRHERVVKNKPWDLEWNLEDVNDADHK